MRLCCILLSITRRWTSGWSPPLGDRGSCCCEHGELIFPFGDSHPDGRDTVLRAHPLKQRLWCERCATGFPDFPASTFVLSSRITRWRDAGEPVALERLRFCHEGLWLGTQASPWTWRALDPVPPSSFHPERQLFSRLHWGSPRKSPFKDVNLTEPSR